MQHPYTINCRERQVVYFGLAVIAFGISLLVGRVLAVLSWTPPTWLDVPGAFALYGLLCWWFDKRLWKMRGIRSLGISTPVLEGHWSGTMRSSYDDFAEQQAVSVRIRQDWTTISICLEGQRSRSHSTVAAISLGPENSLIYCFANQPNVDAPATMHHHAGTVGLRIEPDSLEGEYYSGRDRAMMGSISLTRDRSK